MTSRRTFPKSFGGLAAIGLVLGFAGCRTTAPARSGEGDPARGEYRPSRADRACATDADCIAVSVDCRGACPGGSAVNKKYLASFGAARRAFCDKVPARAADRVPGRPPVCVAAPVRCVSGACTWIYEGPDPSTL